MTATGTTVDVSITARLEAKAEATCAKIADLCTGENSIATELQDKFHAAIADVKRVRLTEIENRHGAFYVEGNTLLLSEEPVARLLQCVLADIQGRSDQVQQQLLPEEVPELLERVFVGYVLHELRHRTQGLTQHSTVQQLKDIAGPSAMAAMDVCADRDAAFGLACTEAKNGTREEFLANFREALFYSSAYFFKVFPPTPDRPDKLERAIAVLLMAARLAVLDLDKPTPERADFPLDAPIVVSLSASQDQLAIFRVEPSKSLLAVSHNIDDVADLVADVKLGDFDSALERSVTIMDKLGLLDAEER